MWPPIEAGFNERTKLVWGETIGNPRMTIPDLIETR